MSAGPLLVEPLAGAFDLEVPVPGSKSHTNRALLCAGLAAGTSGLRGILRADDTEAMVRGIAGLGAEVMLQGDMATVTGIGGEDVGPCEPHAFDVALSGTTARFLAPVLAWRGCGDTLDGGAPLRARPMGDGFAALRSLGARVEAADADALPARFPGPPMGGGATAVAGDVSSQFLSGLLLVGPLLEGGLDIELTSELVSRPYIDLTVRTMRDFGATVSVADSGMRYRVDGGGYAAIDGVYTLEPDASTASYFFAAAALTGSHVVVPGLGRRTVQGDLAFLDILELMGAEVNWADDHVEVRGRTELRGVDVDMAHCSDVVQTLAAVAVFATSPTRIRGVGFIRLKETDRLGKVVAELRRCGIEAHEHDDGLTVVPGTPQPATIHTYDDHRMAMSFALLGLRAEGIRIADPGCVSKTFPGYWDALRRLRG